MSIRCIIKAACIWKHGIPKQTSIADIRRLLADQNAVQPPEWFQAMLTQGVLLLNAALTANSDAAMTTDQHTAFWRPVVEKIIEEILKAKQAADEKHQGVVFAWWGGHARALRSVVERLQKKYPGVSVEHLDHCNPAAQGDIFCNGNHFADVNAALRGLGMDEVDWLPAVGWDKTRLQNEGSAERMGEFIANTMELHKLYLERLQSVKDEGTAELPAVTGLLATPLMNFADAVAPVAKRLAGLDFVVQKSYEFGLNHADGLSAHEVAALHLYTAESPFYRELNAALRHPDRSRVAPYFGYLRLFFSALSKLKGHKESLWRGVALDLRQQYPEGGTITWWGVSSCTSRLSVAQGFLGSRGRRMLFEVTPLQAVGIRTYSAFTGEEEFVLPPGSRFKVIAVKIDRDGLCTVRLKQLADQQLIS
jgi:hypothetical protein